MKVSELSSIFSLDDMAKQLSFTATTLKLNKSQPILTESVHYMYYALSVLSKHKGDTKDAGVAELISHLTESIVMIDMILMNKADTLNEKAVRALLDSSQQCRRFISIYQTQSLVAKK